MAKSNTALGIDISEAAIHMTLLRKSQEGLQLVKAASTSVPAGAVKDGNVEDPALLSRAIRELKRRNNIRWTHHAAVSLLARPVVMQIIDVPHQLPSNMGQYVQNHLKRCVTLSGKSIAFDFHRLGSGKGAADRLFAAATDGRHLAALAESCGQAGLNVELIEPRLLSYTRAFGAKKLAGRFDCNVLLAILEQRGLTVCVFRDQHLDFVRTKDNFESEQGSDELCGRLAEEINEVIRFYNFEVEGSYEKWEITVVADGARLGGGAGGSLQEKIANAGVQVRTVAEAVADTVIEPGVGVDQSSAVSIGLAMRLLDADGGDLRVNLAPPESAEVREVKKHVLVTANIVAGLFSVMVLCSSGLGLLAEKVEQGITDKKQATLSQDTHCLVREQELIEKQIEQLSGGPEKLKSVMGARHSVDWAKILRDVARRTPTKTVRITELHGKKNGSMHIGGLALSYDAVHEFARLLNQSGHIESAGPPQTEKDRDAVDLIRYSIDCVLAQRQQSDVDQ
ncbi:MAG: pilus assembly protein PilM [Planctomycetota bacterium]|jgi:hypothetical protein